MTKEYTDPIQALGHLKKVEKFTTDNLELIQRGLASTGIIEYSQQDIISLIDPGDCVRQWNTDHIDFIKTWATSNGIALLAKDGVIIFTMVS